MLGKKYIRCYGLIMVQELVYEDITVGSDVTKDLEKTDLLDTSVTIIESLDFNSLFLFITS